MNDDEHAELRQAAGQLLSISGELNRLKGAIEEHAELAAGLRGLVSQVEQLSLTLEALPEPLRKVSERGEALIEAVQKTVQPAGELFGSMAELRATLSSFPAAEVIKSRVDELGQHITGLSATVAQSTNEVRDTVAGLPSIGILRGLTESIDQKIEDVASSVTQCRSQIEASTVKLQWTEQALGAIGKLIARLDQRQSQGEQQLAQLTSKIDSIAAELSKVLAESKGTATATSGRLDVLERLARRSLFAILFGRDEDSSQT